MILIALSTIAHPVTHHILEANQLVQIHASVMLDILIQVILQILSVLRIIVLISVLENVKDLQIFAHHATLGQTVIYLEQAVFVMLDTMITMFKFVSNVVLSANPAQPTVLLVQIVYLINIDI